MIHLKLGCRKCDVRYEENVEDSKDYLDIECPNCGEEGYGNTLVYAVEELRPYLEWKSRFESENNLRILDDDGYRNLANQGRDRIPISYQKALLYLANCTVEGLIK